MTRNLQSIPEQYSHPNCAFEGIVFDLGNVLQPYNPWRVVDNMAAVSGRSRWVIALYFRLSRRWQQFDAGRYTKEDFCQRVIGELRLNISVAQFEQAFADMFTVNQQLVALLPELAKRYRLILLSDNNPIHSAYCFGQHHFYALFEQKILSFEVGVCKPSPVIYQRVVDMTQIPPSRLVFIDDKKKNIRGAIAAGMSAIHFSGEEDFVRHIQSHGWLSAS